MIRGGRLCLLAIALGMLAACASRAPMPPPAPVPTPVALPWAAAIGRLDIDGSPRPCTAVLVAPELILTAAHCLNQDGIAARPQDIVFRPNFGAAPDLGAHRGAGIRGMGGAIHKVEKASDIVRDWAVVSISPPVRGVAPLDVQPMTPQEAISRIAAGETLFAAGYHGLGGELQQHAPCTITEDKSINALYAQDMVVTTCIIRISDSGSPIILIDQRGRARILGIFVAFGENKALGLSYGVGSGVFINRLPPPLLSALTVLPISGTN